MIPQPGYGRNQTHGTRRSKPDIRPLREQEPPLSENITFALHIKRTPSNGPIIVLPIYYIVLLVHITST